MLDITRHYVHLSFLSLYERGYKDVHVRRTKYGSKYLTFTAITSEGIKQRYTIYHNDFKQHLVCKIWHCIDSNPYFYTLTPSSRGYDFFLSKFENVLKDVEEFKARELEETLTQFINLSCDTSA